MITRKERLLPRLRVTRFMLLAGLFCESTQRIRRGDRERAKSVTAGNSTGAPTYSQTYKIRSSESQLTRNSDIIESRLRTNTGND